MLNELSKEIHENAINHGWWEEERSFGEIIALCHSELSEALEEYRNGNQNFYYSCDVDCGNVCHCAACGYDKEPKPEGIATELADCIIRILDYCGHEKIDIDRTLEARRAGNDTYELPELISECHGVLSLAYKRREPLHHCLAECINLIQFWCGENGIDINEAIRIKHEYNKTRPYKHGGKVI